MLVKATADGPVQDGSDPDTLQRDHRLEEVRFLTWQRLTHGGSTGKATMQEVFVAF